MSDIVIKPCKVLSSGQALPDACAQESAHDYAPLGGLYYKDADDQVGARYATLYCRRCAETVEVVATYNEADL